MKQHNDKHEYSIQNLLSMDLEDSVYKRCIDDAKSPFQILQLDRTSASEGFDRCNRSTNHNWLHQNSKQRVSSFMLNDRLEGNVDAKSVYPSQNRDRSKSRQRKPIFGESGKGQIDFWPSLVSAFGELFSNGVHDQRQEPRDIPNRSILPLSIPKKQEHRTIPKLSERPLSPVSPLDESLRYQNKQIARYQQEFIAFILKILPKLSLKSTLSVRIYANKSELMHAILNRLQQEEKYGVLVTLFGGDNIQRIDRRLKCQNVPDFLAKLTGMCNQPLKHHQQQEIIQGVERIVSLLCQVEDDIHNYLSIGNRSSELDAIYDIMSNNDKRPKNLLNILSIYLERNNIICDSKELSPLEYVWRNISHKPYTKHEFIDELIRNDYCVKTTSDADDDLNSELMRLGFKRNA